MITGPHTILHDEPAERRQDTRLRTHIDRLLEAKDEEIARLESTIKVLRHNVDQQADIIAELRAREVCDAVGVAYSRPLPSERVSI